MNLDVTIKRERQDGEEYFIKVSIDSNYVFSPLEQNALEQIIQKSLEYFVVSFKEKKE